MKKLIYIISISLLILGCASNEQSSKAQIKPQDSCASSPADETFDHTDIKNDINKPPKPGQHIAMCDLCPANSICRNGLCFCDAESLPARKASQCICKSDHDTKQWDCQD